jgi:hypothetical protein
MKEIIIMDAGYNWGLFFIGGTLFREGWDMKI